MKELKNVLVLLIVALVAAVALAAVLTGRSAVQGYYEYQTLTAPRTLHQMVIESETAGDPQRGHTLWLGAGLAALAVLVFAGFILAMNGGTEFLRQRRLGRKKPKRRPSMPSDAPRIAPVARQAPLLQERYETREENYTNRY